MRGNYRPALDGIRGVAVAGVLLAHGFPGTLTGAGEGVTVFFVLSGYLITSLLMDEHAASGRIRFSVFYLRRAARLLPAFVAVLLATAIAGLAVGVKPAVICAIVLVAISYVSNVIFSVMGRDHPLGNFDIVGWTWTLSIEEQFYLVWPLILSQVFRRKRPVWRIGVIATVLALASTGWYLALVLEGGHGSHAALGTDTRCGALLVGCALAATARAGHRVPAWTGAPALGLLVFVYLFPSYVWSGVVALNILLVPTVAGLLVSAADRPSAGRVGGLLTASPLVYLGRISYGVYLWNSLLHWAFKTVGLPVERGLVLVWIAATVAIAAASERWLERPCRAWARRRADRRHVQVRMGEPVLAATG